jgi:hypothetical protein
VRKICIPAARHGFAAVFRVAPIDGEITFFRIFGGDFNDLVTGFHGDMERIGGTASIWTAFVAINTLIVIVTFDRAFAQIAVTESICAAFRVFNTIPSLSKIWCNLGFHAVDGFIIIETESRLAAVCTGFLIGPFVVFTFL